MMRKSLLFVLLCLGLASVSQAQERSFGTLSLVQKPGPPGPAGPKIEDSPRYARALEIYNHLVQARGDFRYPVPTFTMRREVENVARIDYNRLEIVLEEKAYEVCESFGADIDAAIAFLLGHELTHYYEKHAWRRGFVAEYKDLEIGMKLDSLADAAANETQADYLGGFLAYSAGFGLFNRGDEVIAKLYKAYSIPDKIPGYPSLADRQALGKRSAEKLSLLVDVFDMANMLTAIGRYGEAYDYYRYILMDYQSRETYNNLGVAAVLDALQYFSPQELKFRYPLELDLESSASKGDGMVNRRNQLLRQAILHFDAAISLDPDYAPAYLNKASAFALMDDNARARFYAAVEAKEAARKTNNLKTGIDADILIGILDYKEGHADRAEAAFKAAAAAGSALAAHNLKKLRDEPTGTEKPPLRGAPERIDGKSLLDIPVFDFPYDDKKVAYVSPRFTFFQYPPYGPKSKLFTNYSEREVIFFHIADAGNAGQTARGIKIGDTRDDIVNQYGEPTRTVETPRGEILVYRSTLFIIGPGKKLERWANYLIDG